MSAMLNALENPAGAAVARGTRRRVQLLVLALLFPGLFALVVTFAAPLLWLLRISFSGNSSSGNGLDVHAYVAVLGDAFYWRIIGHTLGLGLLVSLAAVLASYPLALFLSRTESRWRGVLVALAVAPLLTSTIVRTYGWMVLLSDTGVINGAMQALGLINNPLHISNNYTATVIALTEILMPYAILVMLSGLGRVSAELEQAAASLGANRWKVFVRVTLPLSLPGVASAALLVFVLSISSFVTPRANVKSGV